MPVMKSDESSDESEIIPLNEKESLSVKNTIPFQNDIQKEASITKTNIALKSSTRTKVRFPFSNILL